MTTYAIVNRYTFALLYGAEGESFRAVVEAAVAAKIDLTGANLKGADLRGADLRGAKNLPSYVKVTP